MSSSEFPFISVMFAVIMGMGVVYILMAIALIVRGLGTRYTLYWLHLAWVIFLLLLHFHVWWGLWDFQQVTSWNYFSYLFFLSGPVLLFWSVAMIIPDDRKSENIKLKEFYYEHSSKFFIALSLAVIWGMSLYPVFMGILDPVFEWLLLFLIITILLSYVKKPVYHVVLSLIAWGLFLTWILSYGFIIVASE